jgi:hypothetical protein
MNELPDNAILYLDSNRGIYIPRDFFAETKPECIEWTCSAKQKTWILEQCSNPDNEWYWDAWNDAEAFGHVHVIMPETGIEYSLYQDGDLWLIPIDAEWPEDC